MGIMHTKPILIYSDGKNKDYCEIAMKYGYKMGIRLPAKPVVDNIFFADQDWHNPNLQEYVNHISIVKPKLCTVIDIEYPDQFFDAIYWSECISIYCNKIIIIPKCKGIIDNIPEKINNSDIILGFSVPTEYGGTRIPPHMFANRKVHLLGGSPHSQIKLFHYMKQFCEIISIDGNMHKLMSKYCKFWKGGKWISLNSLGISNMNNAHLKAFDLSCRYISEYWNNYAHSI